jgi:lysozyme family protein
MKQNFDVSLAHVLKSEGGWSDHPADPGGATMKGVTLETYRRYKMNPHITKDQLRNITDEEVADIYKIGYWDKCRCFDLPSGVDFLVFDMAINAGVGRSSKLLQESVGVPADGVIGPITIAASNAADVDLTIERFSQLKEAFYRSLPTFGTFGNGWLNRVASTKAFAQKLAQ